MYVEILIRSWDWGFGIGDLNGEIVYLKLWVWVIVIVECVKRIIEGEEWIF